MNRLQKKCFIAAVGMHLLLALTLIVGPGFLSHREEPMDTDILEIIPDTLTDGPTRGGNRNAPPPPAVAQAPPVAVAAPPRQRPAPRREEPKREEPKETKPSPEAIEPAKPKHKIIVSTKPIVRSANSFTNQPQTDHYRPGQPFRGREP